jgi:peptidoglycan/LPS O-acetylase OafA/YrhL
LAVLAILFAVYHGLPGGTPAIQVAGYSALAIGYGAVVWGALDGDATGGFRRVLTSPFLRAAGKYSYCMYLVNSVLIRPIAERVFPGAKSLQLLPFVGYTVLVLAATMSVSWLSWHAYERHFLRLKRFVPMPAQRDEARQISRAV